MRVRNEGRIHPSSEWAQAKVVLRLSETIKEDSMGELTLGVFPSLVGSMWLDFAFKLAEAGMAKGHKVNMWLSSNVVMMDKKAQKAVKDYSNLEKRMKKLMGKGKEITVCEACAE